MGKFTAKFGLVILIAAAVFSGCRKTESGFSSDSILSLDETAQAGDVVKEANAELKKVRKIYKDNQGRVEELKSAMDNKDVAKVKQITDDVLAQIDEGRDLARNAISLIEKAEGMNINETYREYLEKKRYAMLKQLEAFEYRRQTAELLRNAFGGNNVQEIEKVKSVFKEKDDKFQELMEQGRTQSEEANEFAKNSLKKGS